MSFSAAGLRSPFERSRRLRRDVSVKANKASGFGLIELMISMAIASVMVLGLMLMIGNMQSTYSTQTDLSGVSDKQRFAGTLFANNIQTAGYYTVTMPVTFTLPNPIVGALPAQSSAGGQSMAYAAAQVISGSTATGSNNSDQLNLRFQSANSATTVDPAQNSNCQGGVPGTTLSTTYIFESVFYLSGTNLMCNVYTTKTVGGVTTVTAGTPVIVIDGVSLMQIYYGVDVTGKSQSGSVTEYLQATNVPSNSWANVHSIMVQLTFAATNNIASPKPYTQVFQVMYAVP